VYGRYGSWQHQRNALDKTTAGFRRALESALALHAGYPANKASLSGKQGKPAEFKTPVDIPTLSGRYKLDLDWSGKVVPSCVHCHQISDAQRLGYREQRKPMPTELLFPWPMPETLGVKLTAEHAAKIESVAENSFAAKAGLRAGDEFISLAGQPVISHADIGWVLHHSADAAVLAAVVRRGERSAQAATIELPSGWRSKAEVQRRVGTWGMRGMATGGLVLEDLSDDERTQRGLGKDELALIVKFVGQYNKHAGGKNAGFQKDDVIVEIDGIATRRTEGQFIGHVLEKHPVGDKLKTTVLRNGKKLALVLPVQ
jgi:membrane-associated protease RseP (regulator of RpoE activity)